MQAVCDRNEMKYQLFNLKECENKLLQYLQTKKIDGIACDKYFIISNVMLNKSELLIIDNENCYRINKSHCKFANCELLNRHGLVMGSYENIFDLVEEKKEYLTYLIDLKNTIIDIELYWVVEFLKIVYEHLKNRKSAKTNLINNDAIQIMLGDVVVHTKLAEQYRNFTRDFHTENINNYQLLAIKELRLATHLLAKLNGGRSFLVGNVVEMMMIFEYFRDIYFS